MPTLSDFSNAHKWLFIPFIIAILGFFPSYYMKFAEATWHQHMHGLSATAWYLLLILQPYLITRGKVKQHRFYGMMALFVAGAVTFSGITIIPKNLENAANLPPEFAQFTTFFYGVSLLDLLTIGGFAFSVLMAIARVKQPIDHAFWMLSTVFWALMPAFSRLVWFLSKQLFETPPVDFIDTIAYSSIITIIPIVIICWRMKRWHPAMLLVAAANVLYLLVRPVGNSEVWRNIADALFKY